MRRVVAIAFAFVCLFASRAFAETISVAAAISLKDVVMKVAEEYKTETGEVVEFTLGSSGQLASQIQNGAPVDLFISAANKQVDDLEKAGAVDKATRRVIAGNSLVLIVPAGSKSSPDSIKALIRSDITRIAVGEPKTVPVGQYAQQTLKHEGVSNAVQQKLVFATNVRQVLDYVERGEVSAGLVYATDAMISRDKVRVTCIVDEADHEPIVYPAAVVTASKKQAAAVKFLDFLLSEKGQSKLKEFGFTPPPQTATRPIR